MYIPSRPITIFTGNLGSGKTEIAINYALKLLQQGQQVSLVDLDIINPYFRTRLAQQSLSQKGLEVICPPPKLANADVPALSPAIGGALQTQSGYCVCDVGGDDVGAITLGRFKQYLPSERYQFYFVINGCRPLTGTVEGILKILEGVEKNSRLKATALVNNTNLGTETNCEVVLDGYRLVEQAAKKLGLPVAFTATSKELAPELVARGIETPVLPLSFYMLTPWQIN